jgi:hypothetical protein
MLFVISQSLATAVFLFPRIPVLLINFVLPCNKNFQTRIMFFFYAQTTFLFYLLQKESMPANIFCLFPLLITHYENPA